MIVQIPLIRVWMMSNRLPKMPLCVLFDDAYLYPFLIAIYSAALNRTETFSLVIGDTGRNLSPKTKELIEIFCGILEIPFKWFAIPLDTSYQRSFVHVPPLAVGRLFFLDLMESPFVYSDVDVLFLAGWDEILLEPTFSQTHIASVVLHGDTDWIQRINQNRAVEGLPQNQAMIDNENEYFGAGLLIADPQLWRERGFNDEWKEIYKARFDELGLWILEQDILNYLLKGLTKNISVAFNYPAQWREHPKNYRTYAPGEALPIKILQFQGNAKPWNYSEQSRAKLFLKTQDFFTKSAGTVERSTYFLIMEFWLYENLFWHWASQQNESFFEELKTIHLGIDRKDF